jgi:hypothetical protein
MEVSIEKRESVKMDIPVPSFWKDSYCFYYIHKKGDSVTCDAIMDWYPSNKLEFTAGYPVSVIRFHEAEQITAKDFIDAVATLKSKTEDIVNDINTPEDGNF